MPMVINLGSLQRHGAEDADEKKQIQLFQYKNQADTSPFCVYFLRICMRVYFLVPVPSPKWYKYGFSPVVCPCNEICKKINKSF